MEPTIAPAVMLIADISGFTRFILAHDKALRHSQMIVGGLMESLMQQVERPLTILELEGDALFMYAPKTADDEAWQARSRHLFDRMMRLFATFNQRLAELAAYSVCYCEACANIGDLALKIVVHSGEVLITRVGQFPVLSGPDVITIHRMLKNSVGERQYVLMSRAAYDDLPVPADLDVRQGVEEYDTGTIETFHFVPQVRRDFDRSTLLRSFSDDNIAVKILRAEVQREYEDVATHPGRGYHFNTGRPAAEMNEYDPAWTSRVPASVVESFAGTGNPFSMGELERGEHVLDIGSGAGMDAMIAAEMVGTDGHVIGVDMTAAMIEKAATAAREAGLSHVEFREGFAEALPIPDGWADVVISNGSINLCPNKPLVFSEMFRVLRPGGRIQMADITVEKPVPEDARRNIDLWTN
jgi:2-polyprenyl-3-methyl-5-hydroxy-6-metoxy-1,4-benzoquinol methylase